MTKQRFGLGKNDSEPGTRTTLTMSFATLAVVWIVASFPLGVLAQALGVGDHVYNVKDYGAVGDGVFNNDGPIATAIGLAADGGTVYFPPGRYLIRNPIHVTAPIIIRGSGWHRDNLSKGTWLYIADQGQVAFDTLEAQGATIQDLAFYYPGQNASSPVTSYPYAIHVKVDDVQVRNVHLYNPTYGIRIENNDLNGAVGRTVLDRIWGQPLLVGIKVNTALDVVKINNVHFWPFWNSTASANGVAILIQRADNPQLSNIFALGYRYGLKTEASTGSTGGIVSKLVITNMDADFCTYGLELGGTNATAMITNFSAQGNGSGISGIAITGDGARLQAANIRLTNYTTNGIRAQAANSKVFRLS